MKKSYKLYFNLIITILFISVSVAWMVTIASRGEIVNYNRELIINEIDVDIQLYVYNDETLAYELFTEPIIPINNMAPNDTRYYRIDITNNGLTRASTSIILNNITGDIEAFNNTLYFGSTYPIVTKLKLGDAIEETTIGNNMIRFFENFGIDPGETSSIYWYITLDKTAANEVADKQLQIESINFIKP